MSFREGTGYPRRISRREFLGVGAAGAGVLLLGGCAAGGGGQDENNGGGAPDEATIGVSFETLETEFWVAGFDAIKSNIKDRGWKVREAIADSDPNRQLQQVQTMISQQVDGIVLVPKDGQTAMSMIQAANQADIHVAVFNRPPAKINDKSTTVSADDYQLTVDTTEFLVKQLKEVSSVGERPHKAMVLIGNLGDTNAFERRDGFLDTVAKYPDLIEVVAKVPTEWDPQKAKSGSTNAFQANPDIDLIFSSSDFLFPALISAMKEADRYKKIGEEGHVVLGGFDGDATAYEMMVDGYLDATGVQDVYFEADKSVEAIATALRGEDPPNEITDEGFVITQANMEEKKDRMWGAQVATSEG